MAIEITGVDLRKFIADVYALSTPQGLGLLHFKAGPLNDGTIDTIIQNGDERVPVRMDYVGGRACKMTVRRDGNKLFINDSWYDHGTDQLRELLRRHNIAHPG